MATAALAVPALEVAGSAKCLSLEKLLVCEAQRKREASWARICALDPIEWKWKPTLIFPDFPLGSS